MAPPVLYPSLKNIRCKGNSLLGTKIGAGPDRYVFSLRLHTPVATIRPFNTYAPRQSARAVIPTVITQIAAGTES